MPDPHDVREGGSFVVSEEERERLERERQQRLASREPEVPEGWLRRIPTGTWEKRFGYAVPLMLTMFFSAVLILVGVNVVAMRGSLETDFTAWYAGLPLVTLVAVAAGAVAANAAWSKERRSTIGQSIRWGLAAAVSVAFVGFAIIGFVAVVN